MILQNFSFKGTKMNSAHKLGAVLERQTIALNGVVNPLSRYLAIAGAILTLLMSALIVLDIILRSLFNFPIQGTIEFEQFMLSMVIFLTIAYAMIENAHVSVDLISSKFPPKVKVIVGSIRDLLAMFLFIIISWQNVLRAIMAHKEDEIADVSRWPVYPFLFVVAFGSALLVLVLFSNYLKKQTDLLKSFKAPWRWVLFILLMSAMIILSPMLMKEFFTEMSSVTVGLLGVGFLLVLMFMGLPIAFAMGLAGLIGNWYLLGAQTSFGIVRMAVYDTASNFFYCVVPFFILMGFLFFRAGLSKALYNTAYKWFGHLGGGLAIATITGCAGFAAICGDSMATAATMGSVSLPEMKKYRYADSLATGCIAAGGTLGILIPPSVGFIIYGLITEQSIGKLFVGGILPGLLLTFLFIIAVFILCKRNPSLGPKGPKTTFSEKIRSLKQIWPVALTFALVMGGIYLGFFTPTEAGAFGAICALIIALASRKLTWKTFFQTLLEGGRMTAMILTILVGVEILGFFISRSEIPMKISEFLISFDVSRYVIFILVLALYLVLGMAMNIIPMMMLTLPIIFPTIMALGFDPIWFGVIMVIMMEMGQISPPVGINVFVIAGVSQDVPMATIFKGILPFILVEILVVIILTLFPQIIMVLPNAMDVLPGIGS